MPQDNATPPPAAIPPPIAAPHAIAGRQEVATAQEFAPGADHAMLRADTRPRPSTRLRISSRQVTLLNALDECRSLRRAAQAMHTTQPAASALLQQLEQALDVTLFERHARGMRPTPYGEVMIRYARGVLHEYEHAEEELVAMARGASGFVRIGSVMGPVPGLLAHSLATFKLANPRVRMSLLVDTSDLLLPALVRGDLDLVLGRLPDQFDDRDLEVEPFEQGEAMCVVARPSHSLFDRPDLTLADLAALTWILHPSGSPMRRRVEEALRCANVTTTLDIIETASILATTAMVADTDIISVVPLDVARHYEAYGMLRSVPVELPITLAHLGLITRKRRFLSPATRAFLASLRTHLSAVTRAPGPASAVPARPSW